MLPAFALPAFRSVTYLSIALDLPSGDAAEGIAVQLVRKPVQKQHEFWCNVVRLRCCIPQVNHTSLRLKLDNSLW
jgi:hypothetical protein